MKRHFHGPFFLLLLLLLSLSWGQKQKDLKDLFHRMRNLCTRGSRRRRSRSDSFALQRRRSQQLSIKSAVHTTIIQGPLTTDRPGHQANGDPHHHLTNESPIPGVEKPCTTPPIRHHSTPSLNGLDKWHKDTQRAVSLDEELRLAVPGSPSPPKPLDVVGARPAKKTSFESTA